MGERQGPPISPDEILVEALTGRKLPKLEPPPKPTEESKQEGAYLADVAVSRSSAAQSVSDEDEVAQTLAAMADEQAEKGAK